VRLSGYLHRGGTPRLALGFGRPDLSWPPGEIAGVPTPAVSNWCTWLDTRVFGGNCLQVARDPTTGGVAWAFDPEGLASTAGALASMLLGVLVGAWLRPRTTQVRPAIGGLLLGGTAAMALGALLDGWIPINKQLWTSSYALFTAGFACVVLAVCIQICSVDAVRRVAAPLAWYGRNALALFLGSSLAATLAIHLRLPASGTGADVVRLVPWKAWIYARLCEQLPPRQASLVHALGVVAIWAAIAGLLVRRRMFIKL
jgi:predicted acyltransferase